MGLKLTLTLTLTLTQKNTLALTFTPPLILKLTLWNTDVFLGTTTLIVILLVGWVVSYIISLN